MNYCFNLLEILSLTLLFGVSLNFSVNSTSFYGKSSGPLVNDGFINGHQFFDIFVEQIRNIDTLVITS